MHLPDGILIPEVWIPLAGASALAIAVALRKLAAAADPSAARAPIVGLLAAFVFAAQMVNFPVATAVSGHLLGATLLGVLLGPWLTLLIMSSVLILQALLFQDGGITALGANLFNLAIVTNFSGYAIYRILGGKPSPGDAPGFGTRRSVAVLVAAWTSLMLTAGVVSLELAPSGLAPTPRLMFLLAVSHALIGLGEALITLMVLRALHRVGYGGPGHTTFTSHA